MFLSRYFSIVSRFSLSNSDEMSSINSNGAIFVDCWMISLCIKCNKIDKSFCCPLESSELILELFTQILKRRLCGPSDVRFIIKSLARFSFKTWEYVLVWSYPLKYSIYIEPIQGFLL